MKKDYCKKSDSFLIKNLEINVANNSRLYKSSLSKQIKDDIFELKVKRDGLRQKNSQISNIKRSLPNLSEIHKNDKLKSESPSRITTMKILNVDNDNKLKTSKNLVTVSENFQTHENDKNIFINTCNNESNRIKKKKDKSLETISHYENRTSSLILKKIANLTKNDEKKQKKQQFFCPFCQHCNRITDPYLDDYIFSITESKNILSKTADYIINSGIFLKENLDFFDNQIPISNENTSRETKDFESLKNNKIQNKAIDKFISSIPKNPVIDRTTYSVISHFLNALIEDKMSIENIASPDILNKLKDSLISVGNSFDEVNNLIEYDKELDNLFDENTIGIIRKLYESNHIILNRKAN